MLESATTTPAGSPGAARRDEWELVDALRKGDEASFRALVNRYHRGSR